MVALLNRAARAGAMLSLMSLALTGCGVSQSEQIAQVNRAMALDLPSAFDNLTFSVRTRGFGLNPTMIFSGRNSTIVALQPPHEVVNYGRTVAVEVAGLAATKNGRFFTFVYESKASDLASMTVFGYAPCLDSGCRRMGSASELSREEAMQWFFDSANYTPARFEKIFGQPGPVNKVDA